MTERVDSPPRHWTIDDRQILLEPGHRSELNWPWVKAACTRSDDHDLFAWRSTEIARAEELAAFKGVESRTAMGRYQSMFPHGLVHYSRSKRNLPSLGDRGGTRKVFRILP